jgi:hypothetical protein
MILMKVTTGSMTDFVLLRAVMEKDNENVAD